MLAVNNVATIIVTIASAIINHVYEKGLSTQIGDVYVATGDKEIFEEVINNNGKSILTNKKHLTGTDRIFEAFEQLKDKNIDYIINLQGDEPLIDTNDIIRLNNLATNNNCDITTLACKLQKQNIENQNVVKVICDKNIKNKEIGLAKNFTRSLKNINSRNIFHHIGIYIYKVSILKKFVNLKPTLNETNFRLEQLRALDNNIKINVVFSNFVPIGVDTNEDYIEIKNLMEYKS